MPQSSKSRFEAIFNNVSLPMAIADPGYRFIQVNEAFCDFMGYSADELRQMTIEDITHPDDMEATLARRDHLANGNIRKIVTEKRYIHKQGDVLWVRITGSTVTDDEGNVDCYVGIIEDITASKKHQEEKDKLHSQLINTLESMSDAFYLLDKDFRLTYMNGGAEIMAGAKRETCLGWVVWERFPTILETPVYAGLRDSLLKGEPFETEYYSDFMNTWVSLYASPTPDGLAVYFHSISEQKRLMAKLTESEQRLKYVTQATLDAAWDCDLIRRTIWWSNGPDLRFSDEKQNENEFITDIRFWIDRVHPEDVGPIRELIEVALAGSSTSWKAQYRILKRDGNYAFVEDTGFIVRDNSGKAIRMLGGMRDITERLELEEQLRQSQRLESIGHLTGGVAHDFNNLLTVIQGNAELADMLLIDDADTGKYIRMISNAAQKGSQLTQRLLAFARKQPLQPKSININHLVKSMQGLLERSLGEQVDIRLFLMDEVRPTHADPNQLESAILNLCINARDAMPGGGILTIETKNVEIKRSSGDRFNSVKPGAYVCITVSDTGIGITPEAIDHVFEPFFTTKETGKGTGLGLSTVFGFVKQSHGHVEIESEPGKGTSVIIYLPRSETEAEEIPVSRDYTEIPKGTETVLLVEDDPMVLELGQRLLTSFGYNVISASDGNSALEVLETREDIDLLFTDVVMPRGMGGVQLAEKAMEKYPALKILFTSGYTRDSLFLESPQDHQPELLVKPYQPAELAQRIRKLLDN